MPFVLILVLLLFFGCAGSSPVAPVASAPLLPLSLGPVPPAVPLLPTELEEPLVPLQPVTPITPLSPPLESLVPATRSFRLLPGLLAASRTDAQAVTLLDGSVLLMGGVDSTGDALSSAELFEPASRTFTAVGPMHEVRRAFTATLLADGVLVVGGLTENGSLAACELYDPATRTFLPTGSLLESRYDHQAVRLEDGRVLVIGGEFLKNSSSPNVELSSCELYDPASGTFSSTGSMKETRYAFTATLLPDGTVLAAGGQKLASFLATGETYSPSTGTWTQTTGSMSVALSEQRAVRMADGRVLLVGGVNDTSAPLKSGEVYSPASRTFSPTGPMSSGRMEHVAALLPNGQVIVSGGFTQVFTDLTASSDVLDPATLTFSPGPPLSIPRAFAAVATLLDGRPMVLSGGQALSAEILENGAYGVTGGLTRDRATHAAARMADGRVLITGGVDLLGTPLASCEVFDPATQRFTAVASMNRARNGHTCTLLPDGRVLVCGGSGDATGEVYSPGSDSWQLLTMAQQHVFAQATRLLDGTVLVTGGLDGSGAAGASAELFNGSGFVSAGTLVTGRAGHAACRLVDGRVMLIGGSTGTGLENLLTSIEIYADGRFSPFEASLSVARTAHTGTVLPDGSVLVAGGLGDGGRTELSSCERVFPAGSVSGTGSMSLPRSFHTATLLPSGHVIVVGGAAGDAYDSLSGTFSSVGPLVNPRSLHTATLLHSGELLVTGGQTPDQTVLSTAERY